MKKEGHEVRYHIMMKSERDVAEGFVDKVDRWEDSRDWADVIVFDDCEFGALADRLRAAGLTILQRWEFDSFDAAIAFITSTPGRYVVKPSRRAQNE